MYLYGDSPKIPNIIIIFKCDFSMECCSMQTQNY